MATPAFRRHGHSRKAQVGVFTGYVVALLGAIVGLILLAISLWQPSAFSSLTGTAHDVMAPAGSAASSARSGTQDFFAEIRGFFRAGRENVALRDENELARIRLAEAEALKFENARLKDLLDLRQGPAKPITITRFIGSTGTSIRRYGYIGAGARDGVRRGMPVRSERGVLGRVLEVGSHSARVLLLSDSSSVLPVRVARNGVAAFAEGRGDGQLVIKLINLGVNPIKKGDVFVTSGAGGYYRAGIAVAVAHEILTDGAIARVLADPSATDFVAVEPIAMPGLIEAANLEPDAPLPGQSSEANEVSVPVGVRPTQPSTAPPRPTANVPSATAPPSRSNTAQRPARPAPRPTPARTNPAPQPAPQQPTVIRGGSGGNGSGAQPSPRPAPNRGGSQPTPAPQSGLPPPPPPPPPQQGTAQP